MLSFNVVVVGGGGGGGSGGCYCFLEGLRLGHELIFSVHLFMWLSITVCS